MLMKIEEIAKEMYVCPVMSGRQPYKVPCWGNTCAWFIEKPCGYGYCGIIRFHENDLGDGE